VVVVASASPSLTTKSLPTNRKIARTGLKAWRS
jgi:hypothetical protein